MSSEASQAVDWWNPAATLIAAFGGTFFALLLEKFRRKREEIERQLSAARRAVFVISDMWSFVIQHRTDIVEPWIGKDDAWLNMEISNISNWKVMQIDDSSLAYILDSSEANFFQELLMEGRRFDDFQSIIARRDATILDRVFPALGAAIPVGGQISQAEFAKLLGHNTEHELKILTEGIFRKSEDLAKSLPLAKDKFRDVIAKIHPERKIINFVLDPEVSK